MGEPRAHTCKSVLNILTPISVYIVESLIIEKKNWDTNNLGD